MKMLKLDNYKKSGQKSKQRKYIVIGIEKIE